MTDKPLTYAEAGVDIDADTTFRMAEEAQARGRLELEMDERSGGYIVKNVSR